jgi:hypothetical protein
VAVSDDNDPAGDLSVSLVYSGAVSGSVGMTLNGTTFRGTIGPFTFQQVNNAAGAVEVSVTATDSAGRSTTRAAAPIQVLNCVIIG